MSMTSAAAGYFDEVAGRWDAMRAGYFGEEVRDAAIARAYLRPEMVVADVGTGTGFMAAGLAPLVKQVYALDGSAAMLDVARRNLATATNVIFRQADGATLPLEDGSMDAVFANMYLHHCPDPQAAIAEMVRVLRPGGRLVITDMDEHDHAWMREEMADEWLGFPRASMRAWLRAAGLVNLVVDCTAQTCCAKSEADEATAPARIGVFVATGSRRVSGAREAVQASYGAAAEAGVAACGLAPAREAGASTATSCCGSTATMPVGEAAVSTGANCCGSAAAAPAGATKVPTVTSCCGSTSIAPADEAGAPAASGCGCGTASVASAGGAGSSCCASASSAMTLVLNAGEPEVVLYDTGYSAEQLAAVPVEAANLSLGCGNPTAMAGLRPGEVVLDIGSGGGIDVFYAARRVGPGGRAIGLDMTPAMIERARASAQAAGLANVEFRLGQAEAMPIEDGTVDVILSNCVINLAEDKGRVFEEAYRVLRAGGRLSISDMVTEGPLPVDLRGDPRMWAGCINGALPEREYLDLVRQAGFANVTARRTLSGGAIAGVPVYSLSVSAVKG